MKWEKKYVIITDVRFRFHTHSSHKRPVMFCFVLFFLPQCSMALSPVTSFISNSNWIINSWRPIYLSFFYQPIEYKKKHLFSIFILILPLSLFFFVSYWYMANGSISRHHHNNNFGQYKQRKLEWIVLQLYNHFFLLIDYIFNKLSLDEHCFFLLVMI